jgi:hypothetical protein
MIPAAQVPDKVKQELLSRIKAFLSQTQNTNPQNK